MKCPLARLSLSDDVDDFPLEMSKQLITQLNITISDQSNMYILWTMLESFELPAKEFCKDMESRPTVYILPSLLSLVYSGHLI